MMTSRSETREISLHFIAHIVCASKQEAVEEACSLPTDQVKKKRI